MYFVRLFTHESDRLSREVHVMSRSEGVILTLLVGSSVASLW